MTRLRRAKPSDELGAWSHSPERVLVDYNARDSVWKRRRVAELRLYFAETYGERVRATERGLLFAAVTCDHLAEFVDGAKRIDDFLENETEFDGATRARLKDAALAGPIVIYRADELGRILGLTWEVRTRLKITTFDAVDAPSDDARKALHHEKDAAYQRAKRAEASLLKPPSMRHRKAAEQLKRRMLAIYEAVGDGMSVKDLCEILGRPRNGPFSTVKKDLPREVRRVIKDDPNLTTELRPIPGRPDLQPRMWVARKAPPSTSSMEATMTTDTKRPTNEAEYREHVAARLAEFTPATAGKELPDWFNSPAEKSLRDACGITDRKEFLAMANGARKRLLAAEWDTDEG